MNFEQHMQKVAAESPRPAQKVLEVPPEVWAPTWSHRPTGVVQIGMRLISVESELLASDDAVRLANAKHPKHSDDWVQSHNDTLMRWVALESLCEPNDISKKWHGWVQDASQMYLAEDVVRAAVHKDGLKWIWREYERLRVELGLLAQPADDATIQGLIDAMCPFTNEFTALEPGDREIVRLHFGLNATPAHVLRWMTPQERLVFRRHFGYVADVLMNAILRGQQFPIEQAQAEEPKDPNDESIAVMGNAVRQALVAAEMRAAIADAE
jgi:hypothetical protein